MRTLGLDVKYALRSNLQRPWLAGLIVLTLALGLGANAAVLAMVDALIVRPFPFPDVDRILLLSDSARDSEYRREQVSPANFLDWKRQSHRVQRLSAFSWWDVNLVGRGRAGTGAGLPRVRGFLPGARCAAGARPRVRRRRGDPWAATAAPSSAMGLWQRASAADPAIVDARLRWMRSRTRSSASRRRDSTSPWVRRCGRRSRSMPTAAAERTNRTLTVIGRLAPNASLEEARAQMAVIAERLQQQYPGHQSRP
jgi:putative ABC transport system permease protein